MNKFRLFFVYVIFLSPLVVSAADNDVLSDIEQLKKSVLGLEQALSGLEKDVVYPDNTHLQVFVSLTAGQLAEIQSVKIKVDERLVASHIYDEKERKALSHGAIHPLYKANVSQGQHKLYALFQGTDKSGKPWRDAFQYDFSKKRNAALLELIVRDSREKRRAEIGIKEW